MFFKTRIKTNKRSRLFSKCSISFKKCSTEKFDIYKEKGIIYRLQALFAYTV